jgi:predicted RNase H-like HicB family nuclease
MEQPVTARYDANLLYPAPLRDLFIRLAQAGLVRARWTEMIHDEWIRNVLQDKSAISCVRRQTHGLYGILEREADGGYVGSVPALPGCISQGDTRGGALANIREAIELYIEDGREAGDPIPLEDSREYVEVQVPA